MTTKSRISPTFNRPACKLFAVPAPGFAKTSSKRESLVEYCAIIVLTQIRAGKTFTPAELAEKLKVAPFVIGHVLSHGTKTWAHPGLGLYRPAGGAPLLCFENVALCAQRLDPALLTMLLPELGFASMAEFEIWAESLPLAETLAKFEPDLFALINIGRIDPPQED